MGRLILTEPPYTDDPKVYEWMLQVHKLLSGLGTDTTGDIDGTHNIVINGVLSDNIISDAIQTRHVTGNAIQTDHVDWGSGDNQIDTDDMPEGSTNLYFTDERVDDRVDALLVDGNALTKTYDDAANTLTLDVDQAVASADASASTVNVASADADATYSANEVTLINELKTDVNQLVTDVNAIVTSLNDLKANLRTAGLLAT